MEIKTGIEEGVLNLSLNGDLIGEESGAKIIDAVNTNIEAATNGCAVDFSGVRYMNSSGLGVLITIHTKFKNKSGEVIIVNPTSQVIKLLSITKLDTLFSIVESTEEAVSKLK